jgi:hypothetical protein
MTRSDHGKPREKHEPIDLDIPLGELGPFLTLLSGYNPKRNNPDWYAKSNTGLGIWTLEEK